MAEPKYEVWGNWNDDSAHGVEDQFLEDCVTLEEANKAVKEYSQDSVRYAYVKDKDTGEIVV